MNQAYYKKNIDYKTWEEEADETFNGQFSEDKFKTINNTSQPSIRMLYMLTKINNILLNLK